MHGLLFCFQYVPQEHCDFTIHSFSLVWLRNCYIASRLMRNLGVFSLVFPGNCYIASRLMRNLGGFSLIFPGNCYIASRPMRNLGGFSLVFPGNCYITSRPMRNLICSLLSKQVFIISLIYLEGSISV